MMDIFLSGAVCGAGGAVGVLPLSGRRCGSLSSCTETAACSAGPCAGGAGQCGAVGDGVGRCGAAWGGVWLWLWGGGVGRCGAV